MRIWLILEFEGISGTRALGALTYKTLALHRYALLHERAKKSPLKREPTNGLPSQISLGSQSEKRLNGINPLSEEYRLLVLYSTWRL